MERKIGEIFEYNGEWYQCIKNDSCLCDCDYCDFSKLGDCDNIACASGERIDNNSVYFKKLEKVGEPYMVYGHIVQKYKFFHSPAIQIKGMNVLRTINSTNTIKIEIKQNKEDMEENIKEDMEEKKVRLKKEDIDFLYNKFIEITKDCVVKGYNIDNVQHEFGKLFLIKDSDTKLNLKPFDLEAAKSGKPVCTRDGREARIICFDRINDKFPIVALVVNNDKEAIYYYNNDGKDNDDDYEKDYDLVMKPKIKKGWINVHKNNGLYETEEDAKKNQLNDDFVAVKIEFEI